MKNEINMGSSLLDCYMDGYDEGKCDDVKVTKTKAKTKKPSSTKARVSARRKKTYYKSKNRMGQLASVGHYTPSPDVEQVIQGMLRGHQLPMTERKCEHPCGTSIGNKKRQDTVDQKMREANIAGEDDNIVFHHEPIDTNEPFELHGFRHNPA